MLVSTDNVRLTYILVYTQTVRCVRWVGSVRCAVRVHGIVQGRRRVTICPLLPPRVCHRLHGLRLAEGRTGTSQASFGLTSAKRRSAKSLSHRRGAPHDPGRCYGVTIESPDATYGRADHRCRIGGEMESWRRDLHSPFVSAESLSVRLVQR